MIPDCKIGKYHSWKKGLNIFGESGICAKCGYDKFEQRYKPMEEKNEKIQKS